MCCKDTTMRFLLLALNPLISLSEKCPNTEFFLVRIFPIPTEYGKIRKTPGKTYPNKEFLLVPIFPHSD